MADQRSSRPYTRPSFIFGCLSLAFALSLLVGYYRYPFLRRWWPPAFYPLFWSLELLLVLVAAVAIGAALMPPRWKRWIPSLSRSRMSVPKEGIGYLLIMVVLFVGASLTQSNTLLLVFAAMAGPFVVNGSIAYTMLKNARVTRRTPPRVMATEPFSVQLDLENPMAWMSLWMMVAQDEILSGRDAWNPTVLFTRVPPLTTQPGHYQLRLMHRGRYRFGPLQLTSRFPLGLTERGNVFREFSDVLVYPRVGRLSPYWKRRLIGASELVETPQPRAGVFEDEYHHLREYRPGDNPRAIHWRSSARRNTLIVREYQQNREHHLLLVIDLWGDPIQEPVGNLLADADLVDSLALKAEQALSLAATIAAEHRRSCRGAKLTVYGHGRESWRWEARANSSLLESLFDQLAVMQPARSNGLQQGLQDSVGSVSASTRVVVVSTRTEAAAQDAYPGMTGGRGGLQWLTLEGRKFQQLVLFPDSPRTVTTVPTTPATATTKSATAAKSRANASEASAEALTEKSAAVTAGEAQ